MTEAETGATSLNSQIALVRDMETFVVKHSGALDHSHTIVLSPSFIDLAREVRQTVTVVVIGLVAVAAVRGLFGAFTAKKERD